MGNFLTYKISHWLHTVYRIKFKLLIIWFSRPIKTWLLPTPFLPWLSLPLKITVQMYCSVSLFFALTGLSRCCSLFLKYPFLPPLFISTHPSELFSQGSFPEPPRFFPQELAPPYIIAYMYIYCLCGENGSSCCFAHQTIKLWGQEHKASSSTPVMPKGTVHLLSFFKVPLWKDRYYVFFLFIHLSNKSYAWQRNK